MLRCLGGLVVRDVCVGKRRLAMVLRQTHLCSHVDVLAECTRLRGLADVVDLESGLRRLRA